MSPPTESIKAELSHAVARGIRRRGPDAVGLVLIGMARLAITASTLAVLLVAAAAFGYNASGLGLAGATAFAGLLNWLAGRYRP
jgi:hypothetical protein